MSTCSKLQNSPLQHTGHIKCNHNKENICQQSYIVEVPIHTRSSISQHIVQLASYSLPLPSSWSSEVPYHKGCQKRQTFPLHPKQHGTGQVLTEEKRFQILVDRRPQTHPQNKGILELLEQDCPAQNHAVFGPKSQNLLTPYLD